MSETPVEAPNSTTPAVEAPPLAPGAGALCYVVDEETKVRHFISLVLQGAGLDTLEFPDGAALRRSTDKRAPALIIHNISLDASDALNSMVLLGKRGYRGAVQLTSNRGAAVLEHVKTVGVQNNLNMLPVLKKPYETEAILRILDELKLGISAPSVKIELEQALAENWIEFWYQPKIDLRKKQLAGAEAYARARHPQHGVLLPGAFTSGATEASLIKLAELALASALKTSVNFTEIGVNIPLSVNMPLAALSKLPIEEIVKSHPGTAGKWPGLVIDLRESEILPELKQARELGKRLAPHNIRLAIDELGQGHAQLAGFGEIPFDELKIDRQFIADCGADKVNMPLVKAVIDLARKNKRSVVGMGIEKAADATALLTLGCQYGQGFLLGQPMPAERFISLMQRRATPSAREPAQAC